MGDSLYNASNAPRRQDPFKSFSGPLMGRPGVAEFYGYTGSSAAYNFDKGGRGSHVDHDGMPMEGKPGDDMDVTEPVPEEEEEEVEIIGVPTYGGAYTRYDIFGNVFEVTAKYVPPIRPVGRGSYGIVW